MNAPTSNTVLDQLAEAVVGVINEIPTALAGLAPDEWEAAGLPRNFLTLSPAHRFDALRTALDEAAPEQPSAADLDAEQERAREQEANAAEVEKANAEQAEAEKVAKAAEAEAEQERILAENAANTASDAPEPDADPAAFEQPAESDETAASDDAVG